MCVENSPVRSRSFGLRLFFSQQLTAVMMVTTMTKQAMMIVAIPAGVARKLSMFDVIEGISLSPGSSSSAAGVFEIQGGVTFPA